MSHSSNVVRMLVPPFILLMMNSTTLNATKDFLSDETTTIEEFSTRIVACPSCHTVNGRISDYQILSHDTSGATTPTDSIEPGQLQLQTATNAENVFGSSTDTIVFLKKHTSSLHILSYNGLSDDSSGISDASVDSIHETPHLAVDRTAHQLHVPIVDDFDSVEESLILEDDWSKTTDSTTDGPFAGLRTLMAEKPTEEPMTISLVNQSTKQTPTSASQLKVKQSEIKDLVRIIYLFVTISFSILLVIVVGISCVVRRHRKIKTLQRESSLRNQHTMAHAHSKYSFDRFNAKASVDFHEKNCSFDKPAKTEALLMKTFFAKENKTTSCEVENDENGVISERFLNLNHLRPIDDDKCLRLPKIPLTYGQNFIIKGTKSFGIIDDADEHEEPDNTARAFDSLHISRLSLSLYDIEKSSGKNWQSSSAYADVL
jgi:hypothetical protein